MPMEWMSNILYFAGPIIMRYTEFWMAWFSFKMLTNETQEYINLPSNKYFHISAWNRPWLIVSLMLYNNKFLKLTKCNRHFQAVQRLWRPLPTPGLN
jgi:hypothetical protein